LSAAVSYTPQTKKISGTKKFKKEESGGEKKTRTSTLPLFELTLECGSVETNEEEWERRERREGTKVPSQQKRDSLALFHSFLPRATILIIPMCKSIHFTKRVSTYYIRVELNNSL
jgi:hypothetical protein